jgi:hypothetical protein
VNIDCGQLFFLSPVPERRRDRHGPARVRPTRQDSPAAAFSTSTTARIDWINGIIVVPEPGTLVTLMIAAACLPLPALRRRCRRREAVAGRG